MQMRTTQSLRLPRIQATTRPKSRRNCLQGRHRSSGPFRSLSPLANGAVVFSFSLPPLLGILSYQTTNSRTTLLFSFIFSPLLVQFASCKHVSILEGEPHLALRMPESRKQAVAALPSITKPANVSISLPSTASQGWGLESQLLLGSRHQRVTSAHPCLRQQVSACSGMYWYNVFFPSLQ